MKNFTKITLFASAIVGLTCGTVGAQTATSYNDDDGFYWEGTYGGSGVIPTTMTTPRMFWYAKKAAFRSGVASTSTLAADGKIGNYSTAFGQDSVAEGSNSLAAGTGVASGTASTALSFGVASGTASVAASGGEATGDFSMALGPYTYTGDDNAVALGVGSLAIGYRSVSIGADNRSWSSNSVSIGRDSNAGGQDSVAIGNAAHSDGNFSTVIGHKLGARAFSSVVLGSWNVYDATQDLDDWITDEELFVIGNGTSISTTSNALVMTKDANTRMAGNLHVKGVVRTSQGGDITMGDFDSGVDPATLDEALKYSGE